MGHAVGDPAFEALTGRARIRDAAIRLFAERGIAGTTVRDIAREAGVSPGLLRHHFGSKEALREACDVYALDRPPQLKKGRVFVGEGRRCESMVWTGLSKSRRSWSSRGRRPARPSCRRCTRRSCCCTSTSPV